MPSPRFRIFSTLALLLGASAAAIPASAQHTVFAHYLLTNQDYQGDTDPTQEAKITAYEKEIKQAQAAGIDGFALNVGGWLNQTYYIKYAAQMFEAAARLNSGFKLVFSADMCCGNGVNDVEDMMRRFVNDARYNAVYYKQGGRPVLTTFAGETLGVGFWQQVKSDLASGANPSTTTESTVLAEVSGAPSNAGMNIFFVPAFFWGGELPTTAAIQQGFNQFSTVLDGSFYWDIAGVPGSGGSVDQLPSSEGYGQVVHGGGKLYMAPVTLQFWGANANRYYEYSGFSGFRKMWLDAINVSHPEWVELITWNDFIEGSYVSPIDDPNKYPNANYLNTTGVPSSTLGYFHSHSAATDLLPFFIQWYKTGQQPTITKDAVYFAYRTQPASFDAGTPSVANQYGPVSDQIYITANLTAAATLKVTTGGQTSVLSLPAGSTDVQTPFLPGNAPTFELDRNGSPVGSGAGTDPIQATPKYNDYYYSTGDFFGGSGGGGAPVLSPVVQINAGGGTASPFSADKDANAGNQYSNGAAINTSGAANPAPAAVYQSSRWGAFTYTIPGLAAGASYAVRLHFAELTWTAAGRRKFNVTVNGASFLSGYDIFAAAGGQNRAVTAQTTTTATNGQIVISFTNGGVDNPEVSGIEILH